MVGVNVVLCYLYVMDCMSQYYDVVGGIYDVVIQFLVQFLLQVDGVIVKGCVFFLQIVGLDDCGVVVGVVVVQLVFFDYCYVVDIMFFGEVVGGCQIVIIGVDDDYVIFGFWFGCVLLMVLVFVCGKGVFCQFQKGILFYEVIVLYVIEFWFQVCWMYLGCGFVFGLWFDCLYGCQFWCWSVFL